MSVEGILFVMNHLLPLEYLESTIKQKSISNPIPLVKVSHIRIRKYNQICEAFCDVLNILKVINYSNSYRKAL